jgi:Tol biopolymer transport system component
VRPVPGRPTGPGYAAFDRQPAGTGLAEGLLVRPLRVTLVRGESRQLDYMAVNAEGQPADRVPILFSVAPGGENIVSADSLGFLRAAGDVGSATVRATVPGNARILPRQIAVEVRADSVRFSRSELWLTVGTVDTLRVEVPAQDRPMNVWGEFQFSSSDESKLRVSPLLPVVTAMAPGVARVLGESPYFNLAATVHVLRPVALFAATPADSEVMLAMGASLTVAVRALAADTSVVSEAPLRWTLPDSAVARFDTLTRTLRGIRAGETRLAVAAPATRDSSVERAWRIRVVAGGLAVARARVGLGAGERTPVVVQLLDDRRRPIGPTTDLRWTSSADSVATVVEGQIRGQRPGHARLTARSPWDSTVTLDVYVVDQLLASVQRGGRWDLYTFGADSVPRLSPITQSTAVEMEPAWAPDLTRIAYVSAPPDRPTSLDLYVADADGADTRRLTADSATVGAPVFVRPSGDRLIFQSNRGGTVQLYVVDREGAGRARLGTAGVPNSHPDVSPDGSKVLFVSLRAIPNVPRNYDIWEVGIDGTGERRMTTSPRPEDSPLFAPDGRSFYYLRDDGGSPPSKRVYRQSVDDSTGATAQAVTPLGMFVRGFSLRADGNLLVLTRLERVRGVGDVPHVELYDQATGVLTPVQLTAGDQIAAPTFRPPTPRPR